MQGYSVTWLHRARRAVLQVTGVHRGRALNNQSVQNIVYNYRPPVMACYAVTYQRNTLYLKGFQTSHFGDTPQTAEESMYQPNALQSAGFEGRALCVVMWDITPEPLAPTDLRSIILYLLCFKKIYKAIILESYFLILGFPTNFCPYNF